jgi:Spy/CpxP family protein refolding chaperone
MTDEIRTNESEKNETPASDGRAPARRWFGIPALAGVLAVGIGTAGVVATQALGHGKDFGGWRGGGHGEMRDPANMEKNVERGIRHLAVEIDATAEQQAQLVELAKTTAEDLHAFRDMMHGEADELAKLLTQPTVDRAAIEAFRSEKMAELDRLTTRLADAAVKAGEILTPEQRGKIAQFVAERREHRGRHHGWRR